MSPEESERAIIGCALSSPEVVDSSSLDGSHFSVVKNRRAWEAIMRIALNGDPMTIASVAEASGVEASYLSAAEDDGCHPLQAAWYAKEIRSAAFRRRLISTCRYAAERLEQANGIDPTPEVAAELAAALDETPGAERPQSLPFFVEKILDDLPKRREQGKPGASTGFPMLDEMIGGLRPGSLFIIAAATGVGKSIFAANLVLGTRVPSLLCSLEMSGIEVAERMIAAAGAVESYRIQRGQVDADDLASIRTIARERTGIWIDERPAPSVEEIGATARSFVRQESIGLLVVDYLQIVRTVREERREAEVAHVARSLRALARKLNIPVVGLSQLNREGEIRDSSVIEHEAHVVGVFTRKKGESEAQLEIRKNRHGPEGRIDLFFNRKTLELREIDRG